MKSTVMAMLVAVGVNATGQSAPAAVLQPHPLGPIVARSAVTFNNVARVLVIHGSVFVHDAGSRQILVFDSTLGRSRVVLDSAGGRDNSTEVTSTAPVGMYRFRGDSLAWLPPNAIQAVIIGPDGRVGRVAAMPPFRLVGMQCASDVTDRGMLTCKSSVGHNLTRAMAQARATPGATVVVTEADSNPILAIDFATWRVDTLGYALARFEGAKATSRQDIKVTPEYQAIYMPMSPTDDWAMFHDGTLAIIRGIDYHVDIVSPDGATTRGPTIPYDWRLITDAQRVAITDSLRRMDSASRVAAIRRNDSLTAVGGGRAANGRLIPPAPIGPGRILRPAAEWPTYWPPFNQTGAALMVDADDHIWLRETTRPEADTTQVYAVIDRRGTLVDRVAIPRGESIRGFGPGGLVYLAASDGGRLFLLCARTR